MSAVFWRRVNGLGHGVGRFGPWGSREDRPPPFPRAMDGTAEAWKKALFHASTGIEGRTIGAEKLLGDAPIVFQIRPSGRELDHDPVG
jgi:hypothetical protein